MFLFSNSDYARWNTIKDCISLQLDIIPAYIKMEAIYTQDELVHVYDGLMCDASTPPTPPPKSVHLTLFKVSYSRLSLFLASEIRSSLLVFPLI